MHINTIPYPISKRRVDDSTAIQRFRRDFYEVLSPLLSRCQQHMQRALDPEPVRLLIIPISSISTKLRVEIPDHPCQDSLHLSQGKTKRTVSELNWDC